MELIKNTILVIVMLAVGVASAQEVAAPVNPYGGGGYQSSGGYDVDVFVPKPGSQFGLSGSFDKTGMLMGNFDVYPNNKVFVGAAYGSRDVINTRDLLQTESVVAGRLGLRIAPWLYMVGTAGNHRYDPPHYDWGGISDDLRTAIENLPYKDEFFWGAGLQIRIPYIIFNDFKFVAGIMYTNRNTYEFEAINFETGEIRTLSDGVDAAGQIFNHLINSDLTFTVGVTIPLTPYRSKGHQERVDRRKKFKDMKKELKLKKRFKS